MSKAKVEGQGGSQHGEGDSASKEGESSSRGRSGGRGAEMIAVITRTNTIIEERSGTLFSFNPKFQKID